MRQSCTGSDEIGTFSLITLLLSVFNIINLVASNVNNNNNRNNINDNAGNINTADNTESNANANGMTATQVMMVPPGVGRRKRDTLSSLKGQNGSTTLWANSSMVVLDNVLTCELPTQLTPDFIEELPLGIMMALNAWQVAEHGKAACHERNFCELGLNSGVFGKGSMLVGRLASQIMARWLADHDKHEHDLIEAYSRGESFEDCHTLYGDQCQTEEWTSHLDEIKTGAKCGQA